MINSWPNVVIACDISGYLSGADKNKDIEMHGQQNIKKYICLLKCTPCRLLNSPNGKV